MRYKTIKFVVFITMVLFPNIFLWLGANERFELKNTNIQAF
jgi:hypothetical protein